MELVYRGSDTHELLPVANTPSDRITDNGKQTVTYRNYANDQNDALCIGSDNGR